MHHLQEAYEKFGGAEGLNQKLKTKEPDAGKMAQMEQMMQTLQTNQ